MDNLCHTLTGAALSRAGLGGRTRFGPTALLVGANIPDLDVLVFATDHSMLAFRRGWTHGIVAQIALPVALTGILWIVGRRSSPGPMRVRPGWLLALSYLGVLSHVLLDYLNTYGIRLLAPLDWRWYYGDAVFVVDPWLWLVLGGGVWLSGRRRAPGGSRIALGVAAAYVGAMLVSGQIARTRVAEAWLDAGGGAPEALMVGPVPVWPLSREVILDAGDQYVTGRFTFPSHVEFAPERIPKNASGSSVAAAGRETDVRGFLVWSRFPYWTAAREGGDALRVTVSDVRFRARGGDRFRASAIVPGQ